MVCREIDLKFRYVTSRMSVGAKGHAMAKGKGKIVRDGLNGSVTHLLHRALQLALDYHADAAGSASLTQRQFTVLSAAASAESKPCSFSWTRIARCRQRCASA